MQHHAMNYGYQLERCSSPRYVPSPDTVGYPQTSPQTFSGEQQYPIQTGHSSDVFSTSTPQQNSYSRQFPTHWNYPQSYTEPPPRETYTPRPPSPLLHGAYSRSRTSLEQEQAFPFIPTPSATAHSFSNFATGTYKTEYNAPHPSPQAGTQLCQLPSYYHPSASGSTPLRAQPYEQFTGPDAHNPIRSSTSAHGHLTHSGPPAVKQSPVPTDRFLCDLCGRTFSRAHDRKRHHESQHLPVPHVYRCRYCEREFSRADSLKRHIDNGCEVALSAS